MDKKQVIAELKEILIKCLELKISPEEIDGENLITELGINSIDAMEMLILMENNFEIEVDDEDLNADLIKSLDSLSEYVLKKVK